MVIIDMIIESLKRFTLDTPELVGRTGVWYGAAKVLSGRFVSANWSVGDLVRRRARSWRTMT